MSFTWSDDLKTGLPEIDEQHKALIQQFNELLSACAQNNGQEELTRFVRFLTVYVRIHFQDEEKFMAGRSYGGMALHI